jgi:hypothetical protein
MALDVIRRRRWVYRAMALSAEQFENGSWETIYYLELDRQDPFDDAPGPNVAISAVGYGPAAIKARIPDVPPGTYRVRQDMSRDGFVPSSVLMTLYATIQIIAQ